MKNAILAPTHLLAEFGEIVSSNPWYLPNYMPSGKHIAARWEVLERVTRNFHKPSFGIREVETPYGTARVQNKVVLNNTFCKLLHFKKTWESGGVYKQPAVLIVAPLSGHFATLLRDTVSTLLKDHDVYITDWLNARDIPLIYGDFTLSTYMDYVDEYMEHIYNVHGSFNVVAVCQPSVPTLAVTAVLSEKGVGYLPKTLTLIGGPIDSRANRSSFNQLAEDKGLDWFENNLLAYIPPYYPGAFRRVCPGFVLLSGFMSMHMDKHMDAQFDHFKHLVTGDNESVDSHRRFYDEYLAVMDLPAEYYLESVQTVFQKHLLPKGQMKWHDHKVNLKAIKATALLAVEGGRDDISCPGQTLAALELCSGLKASQKQHYLQDNVGHYGLFNGSRWRNEISKKIYAFIQAHDRIE